MSRLKTMPPQRKRRVSLTLDEALKRVDNPELAHSLSIFFSELALAQAEGDHEMVREANRAIAEALRGDPDGPIDMPLLTALRRRRRKR
jgi:hypothetical protein